MFPRFANQSQLYISLAHSRGIDRKYDLNVFEDVVKNVFRFINIKSGMRRSTACDAAAILSQN